MKSHKIPTDGRVAWGVAVVLLLISAPFFASCSTPTTPLSTSSRIPAGKGNVRARTDSNQNTRLEIEVRHLAKPERVASDATTYVVWAESFDKPGNPQNIGTLTVDRNLNGKLETATPFRNFNLFVTAEPSGATLVPSSDRIMWAVVSNGVVS